MFGYSIKIAQFFEGKRQSISNGYYCFSEKTIKHTNEKPNSAIIGLEELEDLIFEGYSNLLTKFIQSEDNKDVYCLCLFTSEHGDLLLYINNEKMYSEAKSSYGSDDEDMSLKMSLGDFDIMLDCIEGLDGDMLSKMKVFIALNYYINISKQWYLKEMKNVNLCYDSIVFDNALYYLLDKVLSRLKNKINQLNKTGDFICYPSCGDDYIDYNLAIRKHVPENIYYSLLPQMKKADTTFNDYVNSLKTLSDDELFETLCQQFISNTHRTSDIFSKTLRNEYEAVRILDKRFTVKKSMRILKKLINNKSRDEKTTKSKIFLLCCVLVNQSVNNKIPINKLSKLVEKSNYVNKDLNDTISYLRNIK